MDIYTANAGQVARVWQVIGCARWLTAIILTGDVMTTVEVKWLEERLFQGIGSNGNTALMSPTDGPGVSPMQMLLLGLGGCTAYDVVDILQKQRQPLAGLDVVVTGERGAEQPKPWTEIRVLYRFRGDGLDAGKVERAIALSVEKYCGALATVAGVATVTHDYEILPAGDPVQEPAAAA